MAWVRQSDKPLPEPMTIEFIGVYMRHQASMIWGTFVHVEIHICFPHGVDEWYH